jgi:2-methylcitrate dehydratase PrpD
MADGTGATRTLAEFAATLTLDDVPAAVRHQAQRIIVDTLICAPFEAAYDAWPF